MPGIKTRPNMPRLDDLYTGVTDDSFDRIASSTRMVSQQAQAMGVKEANLMGSQDYSEDYSSYGDDYEYVSEEDQRMAQILSQEDPEAELHAGDFSFYLYPDYSAIMEVDRRSACVAVNQYDYEEDLEEAWDSCYKMSRRRDF